MRTDDNLALAIEARRDERYADAHAHLIECLESAANIGDGERLANALLVFADNVYEWCPEGDDPFEARKAAAEEALSIFRNLGDKKGEASALLILASVDFDRSRGFAEASLTIAREIGDRAMVAQALLQLGNHASLAGNKQDALLTINEAVRLAEEGDDVELLVDSLLALGLVHEDDDARVAAFDAIAKLEGGYRRKRRFANRLSAAASLIDEFAPERAIEWSNQCLAIARNLSDAQLEGSVLCGLAQIERARGNHLKAEELDALSSVMCPLPDLTEVIKAAEARDVQALDKAMRALVLKKSP